MHVVNGFNENANVRNPLASLDEAMNDTLGWLARVNTKISYLYRDADNYKMRHEVVIAGSMSEEQEKAIEDSLDEGVYFIPSQVGLPDDRFGSVTEADHPWFEWVGVEPTADRPTLHVTAEELTAKFVDAANGGTESTDAPTDGLRPYSVTVRETLSRSVIIWADSHEGAEEKAADLSNDGTISLTDQDFIDREIECNGVAGAYDLSHIQAVRQGGVNMAYEIELHYGFERSHDTYETYHAFEATDIEEEADDAAIEAKLAGLLDCSPDDEDFDCKSMRVALPERTVERIRAEGYAAGRVGILAQMIEGPWNNDACKGYAIMAMERAGLDPETIRKVSGAMTDCFDDTTVAEAGRYYVKGAVR